MSAACHRTRRLRLVLPMLAALLLVACASKAPRPEAGPAAWPPPRPGAASLPGNNVAFRALGLVGTPYRRAGSDPAQGFDCSGFVQYVFRDGGLSLPRSTREQFGSGPPVRRSASLRTGDLVFFNTGGSGVSHVGIYVGEGRFVHAPNHGGRVRLDRLDDDYWRLRFLGGRRVL